MISINDIFIRLGLTEGKASEATSRCQIRWIHFDLSRPCSRCARHAASACDRRKTRLDAEATTRGGAGGPKCCCVLCHRCYRLILQRRLTCLFDQIRTMQQLLFIIWCTVQSVDFFQTSKLSASRTWTLGSSFALELRSHQDQENPDLLGEGGILQSCGFREVAAEHGLVIIPNKPTIKTAPWFRCNIKPPNNQTFRTPLTAPMIWQLWQSSLRNQGLEQGGQYHEISTGRGKEVSALEDV